jgi:tetratricopeptide (TPR) repeat protein
VIERCLSKEPGERFTSADELCHALRELTGTTTSAMKTETFAAATKASAAFERNDWKTAYQEFHALDEQRGLEPAELEMCGICASWLNQFDESGQLWERSYAAYAKSGMNAAAARVALELAGLYIEKKADTIAAGWQKRAERLLQKEPECIEHGYLLRRQTMTALGKCDFEHALELNRKCSEIADRFQNLDFQIVALHDRGQILIARGDVEEGTGYVDEAMISAVSGEVNPTTLGSLYCRTMTVCSSLADFKRAGEWSEAAWRWCDLHDAPGYRGVCRIHSAETMRHLGKWEEAEQAVRQACQEFTENNLGGHAGSAYYELGELALRKGDFRGAEEAFRRAHEYGHDPVPGLPLLRLAQGDERAALQVIQRALHEYPEDQLRRAKLLAATTSIALANQDQTIAQAAAEELTAIARDFTCPCFEAHGLLSLGLVELDHGDLQAATQAFRTAWSTFNELGFPYDAARARTLLGKAYLKADNHEDARLQLAAAGKTFQELGAKPDQELTSELMKLAR